MCYINEPQLWLYTCFFLIKLGNGKKYNMSPTMTTMTTVSLFVFMCVWERARAQKWYFRDLYNYNVDSYLTSRWSNSPVHPLFYLHSLTPPFPSSPCPACPHLILLILSYILLLPRKALWMLWDHFHLSLSSGFKVSSQAHHDFHIRLIMIFCRIYCHVNFPYMCHYMYD